MSLFLLSIKCVFGFSPAEFPTPKTELVQKFQVLYLGMLPVARPIGQSDLQTILIYNLMKAKYIMQVGVNDLIIDRLFNIMFVFFFFVYVLNSDLWLQVWTY